jgi:hypothetical protein
MNQMPFVFERVKPGGGAGDRPWMNEAESTSNFVVDNEARDYLFRALENCRENRLRYYSRIWTAVFSIIFAFVVGGALWACYHLKPTPEKVRQRRMELKKNILMRMNEFSNPYGELQIWHHPRPGTY